MEVQDKVRKMRELRQWSQEDMAGRLGMSTNGYAKIERGESRLSIAKLEKIAEVLEVELSDLLALNEKTVICLISENSQHSSNYYGNNQEQLLHAQMKELQLQLQHRDELLVLKESLLQQQANEIAMLRDMLAFLKKEAEAD